jgi:Protein of unknown function (DUF4235)
MLAMIVRGGAHVYRLCGEKNTGPVRLPARRGSVPGAMGLIYKPIGLVLGILGGLLGKKLFDFVWTKIDDEEPPEATTRDVAWPRLLGAAALQGVIFRTVRFAVDRYGAIGWHYLTGVWPGEEKPDPD